MKVYIRYRDGEIAVLSQYDSDVVRIIKDLDMRRFLRDTNEWIISLSEAQGLIERLRRTGHEVIVEHNAKELNLK